MSLFKRREKTFGSEIEPDCIYCRYNSGNEDVICAYKSENSSCKNYEYDPTMRTPKGQPKLKKYSEDDFLL